MKQLVSTWALIVAGVFAAVTLSSPATAQTSVNSCGQTLSKAGQYVLSTNLDCSGTLASGINITANNVVFHLANHTISSQDCDLSKDIDGISVQGSLTAVRIDGGTVKGFNDGIVLTSSHSLISGVTVTGACAFGIALQGDHNRVESSLVRSNVEGIGLQVSTFHVISGNQISDNATGIGFSNHANNNTVINNRILRNGAVAHHGFGVLISFGTSNLIENNEVNRNFIGVDLEDSGNTVQRNIVNANGEGISVDVAGPNTVTGNAVYGNAPDMVDLNVACAANIWTGNAFKTDVVHGAPDGGPKSGCIR